MFKVVSVLKMVHLLSAIFWFNVMLNLWLGLKLMRSGRFDLNCVKLIIVDIAKSLPIAFHDFSIPFW